MERTIDGGVVTEGLRQKVMSDRWATFGQHRIRVVSVTLNDNRSIARNLPLHRVDAVRLGSGACWFYVTDADVGKYLPRPPAGPDTVDTGADDRMRIL